MADHRTATRREFLGLLAAAGGGVLLSQPKWCRGAADRISNGAGNSLQSAMRLAGECCLAWQDPAREYFPWGGYEVAHDVGRWWNALPRLEAATGFVIPPQLESAMLGHLWRLTSNPDALLFNDPAIEILREKKTHLNLHNLREGLLAFAVLHRFRGNAWARERGRQLIETMAACLWPNGGMDVTRLKSAGRYGLNPDPIQFPPADSIVWYDCCGSTGRALEAVVYFHQVTGDSAALELARRMTNAVMTHVLTQDGSVRPEILAPDHAGHNHSYLGTLRGALLYGVQAGQPDVVKRVYATYRRAVLGTLVTESGWSPHDLGKIRFPNADGDPLAETGSCADAVQLGLWLALKAGYLECLDDVERLIRARILPEQIVESDDPRRRGGWGVHREPHGRSSTFDVFAAVLATLVDVYENAVTERDGVISVNLTLPVETAIADIAEVRSEEGARVSVKVKRPGDVRFRVPGWTPRDSVRLEVGGARKSLRFEGPYLKVDRPLPASAGTIHVSYALPLRETVEVMPVSGKQYRLSWRGDDVIACDPPTAIWPTKRK